MNYGRIDPPQRVESPESSLLKSIISEPIKY